VLGAFPFYTPADLKSYLLTQAAAARGAPGPDNVFGAGELLLPAPPGGSGGTGGGVGGTAAGGSSGVGGSGGSASHGSQGGQVCNTNIGLSKQARKLRRGAITLNFTLPRRTNCRVTVRIWRAGRKAVLFGETTALLSGAKTHRKSLQLRINSAGLRALKRKRRIKAEIHVQAGTGAGRSASAFMTKRIVLKR
jgi:hypothetical protein